MKIKHHGKKGVRLRQAVPQVRQPRKQHKEVVSDKRHQWQKIPYRIVRRGC